MKRFAAALLAISVAVGSLILGASDGLASPFTLSFEGVLTDGSNLGVSGKITVDGYAAPNTTASGGRDINFYDMQSSFSVTIDGTGTFSRNSAFNVATTIRGNDPNIFGVPHVVMAINFVPTVFEPLGGSFVLISENTDPSIPLLTFENMPKNFAAWVALFGPLADNAISAVGAFRFKVTDYTVTTTPIPASLLLFGTALAGLGGFKLRRRMAAGALQRQD